MPWLETRFYSSDPDNDNLGGDSMLVEVRIRPQSANISRANGFTFAIGVLLDSHAELPRLLARRTGQAVRSRRHEPSRPRAAR